MASRQSIICQKRIEVEEARARVADNAVDFSSVKVQHV